MWPFNGWKRQGTGRRRRPAGEPNPPPVKPWWFDWDEWHSTRPDWKALRKHKDRFAVLQPFRGQPMRGHCQNASVGELVDPGGTDERVEVVLYRLTDSNVYHHEFRSSGVALTFSRTLPPFGFYPKSPHWQPAWGDFRHSVPDAKRVLREYDALAALGPGHEETKVLVADDQVFSALVRPEVLQRPQLSGRHVRLSGNHAIAWSKGDQAPAMLEELAIELYELVNRLPRT